MLSWIMLFVWMLGVHADDLIQSFLLENQKKEVQAMEIIRQLDMQQRYIALSDFLEKNPENLICQYALMKTSYELGQPNQLRKFYHQQLRLSKIQKNSTSIMVWHYMLGEYHRSKYEGDGHLSQAYLGLHHFQASLQSSLDFLPSWLGAYKILVKIPNEKNQFASLTCQHHIYRILNDISMNPTFFRIPMTELPENSTPCSRIEQTRERKKGIQEPMFCFLETNIHFLHWLPENSLSEVQLLLQACDYCYQEGQHWENPDSPLFYAHALEYALWGIERLYIVISKEKDFRKYVDLERSLHQYAGKIYHIRKMYALAEEQEFILEYVLK